MRWAPETWEARQRPPRKGAASRRREHLTSSHGSGSAGRARPGEATASQRGDGAARQGLCSAPLGGRGREPRAQGCERPGGPGLPGGGRVEPRRRSTRLDLPVHRDSGSAPRTPARRAVGPQVGPRARRERLERFVRGREGPTMVLAAGWEPSGSGKPGGSRARDHRGKKAVAMPVPALRRLSGRGVKRGTTSSPQT